MPNTREFKASTVRWFLQMALTHKGLINYELPQLLRETSLIGNSIFFIKLKEILQQYQVNDSELFKKIILLKEEGNEKVKKEKEKEKKEKKEKDKDKEKEKVLQKSVSHIIDKEKALPYNAYFYAECVKYLVNSCALIDWQNCHMKAAWRIFSQQIKKIYNDAKEQKSAKEPKPPQIFKTSIVHDVLLEFLGQLCFLGFHENAEVIHNFLHHAIKATEKQRDGSADPENFSANITGPLCNLLELVGSIAPEETPQPQTDDEKALYKTRLEGNEAKNLRPFVAFWVTHPFFSRTFKKEHYHLRRQNQELFGRELDVLQEINSRERNASLLVLEQMCGKLSLNPPALLPSKHKVEREDRTVSAKNLFKAFSNPFDITHPVIRTAQLTVSAKLSPIVPAKSCDISPPTPMSGEATPLARPLPSPPSVVEINPHEKYTKPLPPIPVEIGHSRNGARPPILILHPLAADSSAESLSPASVTSDPFSPSSTSRSEDMEGFTPKP